MTITVGLVGNPNVGKTSLFNRLVGARQYVANWPGVTVSRVEGATVHKGYTLHFVDLPGVYTLSATSIDEKVTRDYLFFSPPNVVVVIIDSMSPEQGIYLLLEALELNLNVIAVFNAIDELRKSGTVVDKSVLETFLGIPVVLTSAHTGEGIEELMDTIIRVFKGRDRPKVFPYPEHVEEELKRIEASVPKELAQRFCALKVIEGDKFIRDLVGDVGLDLKKEIYSALATDIARARYNFATELVSKAYRSSGRLLTLNEAMDHVFTHKFIGIPIFLSIMYLAFNFTFKASEPLVKVIEAGFDKLSTLIGEENIFASLISQGFIGGVGSVLAFVPSIFALFIALGIMEESGYLPRIAFLMDRAMYRLRLTGRSFMTLLLGFGCNVSTVMAARGLADERERLTTILVSPFISCSARLPVYLMITAIAFPEYRAEAFFAIYAASILLTAFSSRVINRVILKGQSVPLIMEVPRYRLPKISNVLTYTWNRGKHFLEKASTIILTASVVIWVLSYFPSGGNVEKSFVAVLGRFLEPLFKPLGYSWQIVTALIFGGIAKEVVVSTFSQLYGTLEGISMDPVVGASLMVFVLAYVPCLATIAAIKSETGSWKYALFSVFYSFALAYTLALFVRLFGRFILSVC